MTIFESNLDMVQPSLVAPRRTAKYANVPDMVDLTWLNRDDLVQEPIPEYTYEGELNNLTFKFGPAVKLSFPPLHMAGIRVVMFPRRTDRLVKGKEYIMVASLNNNLYIYSDDVDFDDSWLFMNMEENHKYVFADIRIPSWMRYEFKAMERRNRDDTI
jgi:hypothetical protein